MCVIWGIPCLLIRVAVREVTPATLVFLRTGIATLLLLPVAAHRAEPRPVLARWRIVAVFALVDTAVPPVLLSSAERRVASSHAALLIPAPPCLGAARCPGTGGQRLDGRRL